MSIPKIYGFNKTSESGVKVFAPSIFIQGCNFQCPFCFNAVLAKSKMKKKDIVPLEIVDNFVDKEKPEMIMISGGEPFMLKNIVELIDHFIDKGLKIGISTHGVFPDRLRTLLPKIDYVALDIKSSNPEVYEFLDLISDNNSFVRTLVSKAILEDRKQINDKFDFEIRTTLYPEYVDEKEIHTIGRTIKNNNRWILQQYRPTKFLYDMSITKGVDPYDHDELKKLLDIARIYTKEAHLRYV
jgi:pyruvate formate lyase activating enzyme